MDTPSVNFPLKGMLVRRIHYLPILNVQEIIFGQIRENEEIQGIRIDTQSKELKISAYAADDGISSLKRSLQ